MDGAAVVILWQAVPLMPEAFSSAGHADRAVCQGATTSAVLVLPPGRYSKLFAVLLTIYVAEPLLSQVWLAWRQHACWVVCGPALQQHMHLCRIAAIAGCRERAFAGCWLHH